MFIDDVLATNRRPCHAATPMIQLVTNGTVITGPQRTCAMAIEDGVVVALGDEALDWSTSWHEVIDLDGGVALPGFRDGHAHPLTGGLDKVMLSLAGLGSIEAIQAAVRRWAETHPELTWIEGRGYDPSLLPRGVGDAVVLDAAVSDRPVALHSSDYHMLWVNTAALNAAGISADTPDPELGTIVRHGDGSPVGTLLEWDAMALVGRHIPVLDLESRLVGLRSGMDTLSANGIVWVQDAVADADTLAVYLAGLRSGLFTCRVNLAWQAEPRSWVRQRAEFGAARATLGADPAEARWLTGNTVKFFADGVIEGGTGFLLEPYDDEPGCCGLPNWAPDALAEAVRAFDADGFQIHIHAIGDGGVRMALDAIEFAVLHNGRRDRRPVIAHTQVVDLADRARFAQLGVIANFEPLWACLDSNMVELTIPRLGPRRTALQFPIRSLQGLGGPISFGSDWPVSSINPLLGMSVAVTRQNAQGDPESGWLPEERLPIAQALAAYTSGSAYQAFDDAAGTLAVGAPADFCVLEKDITSMSGREIADVAVVQTYLGGLRAGRADSGD
jgi:predicted amidohydrolase YtcJ